MALIEINEPTPRALRWFGLPFAVFFSVIGTLLYDAHEPRLSYGVWVAASLVLGAYYALPRLRRPVYLGWMYAAFPLGWVVSHLVMAVVYYLVVTPVGLVSRLVRTDTLQRKRDDQAASYWQRRSKREGSASYFRQF